MENKDIFENEWEQTEAPEAEMKQIQRSIRKRNWKLIGISLTLAAAILVVCMYGIVPLIESFYWHPDTAKNATNASDLTLTLHAYTELFCPGWEVNHVTWQEAEGLAAYNLQISIRDERNMTFFDLDGDLKKGNLMYGPDFADQAANPSWFSGLVEEYAPVKEAELAETREKLMQLPEYIALEAAITFPEDLSMAELEAFYENYGLVTLVQPQLRIIWVGIRNYNDPENRIKLCGMDPYSGGIGFEGVDEAYPNFSNILDYPHEEALENHFKSLLQYSSDQWKKGEGIPVWIGRDYYKSVLDYVEEHGVKSYGAVVITSPQTLLTLLDQGVISHVTLLDAWIDV